MLITISDLTPDRSLQYMNGRNIRCMDELGRLIYKINQTI